MGKVADGRTFAQELRIGADDDIQIRSKLAQAALDIAAGADRHGRFGRNDRTDIEMRRHLVHRLEDIGEIGVSVAAAHRRPDGEKHKLGLLHRRGRGRWKNGGGQRLRCAREARRDRARRSAPRLFSSRRDAVGVLVDAGYGPAEFGKASRRDEPHIARTDHADLHDRPRLLRSLGSSSVRHRPFDFCA